MREAVDAPLNPNLLLPKFPMLPSFLLSLSSADETNKDQTKFFFPLLSTKKLLKFRHCLLFQRKFWKPYFRGLFNAAENIRLAWKETFHQTEQCDLFLRKLNLKYCLILRVFVTNLQKS
jgi:hypothetical protein